MDITEFNFLPAAYDKIVLIKEGMLNIADGMYESQTVYTNGVGFFIPIVLLSSDKVKWYVPEYPPIDNFGGKILRGDVTVYSDRIFFSGTRTDTNGPLYWKVVGLEI